MWNRGNRSRSNSSTEALLRDQRRDCRTGGTAADHDDIGIRGSGLGFGVRDSGFGIRRFL